MIDAKKARELSDTPLSVDEEIHQIELLIIEAADKQETSIKLRHVHKANKQMLKKLGYQVMSRYKGQDDVAVPLDVIVSW